MKRFYTLLFGITLVSSFGVAKTGKIDAKYQASKKNKTEYKNAKLKSSKLVAYTVNSGDTLYSIAKKYQTTVAKVTIVNNLKQNDKLKIGRELKIPASIHSPDEKNADITLASVIREIEENKKKEKAIKVASVQKVAKKEKSSSKIKAEKKKTTKNMASYKVKKGDSLYAIAKNNHTTVDKLKKLNKIKSEKNLKYGQILNIPAASQTAKAKLKVAKAKIKEKTKIAKVTKKKNKKIVSTKKSSRQKLVIDGNTGGMTLRSLISSSSTSTLKLASAKKQLGKRYVWGATGPRTFDCSGFTSYVCKKNGVCIPRTSINQSKVGKRVSRSNLKAGDLVFFDTSKRRRGYINHVGIYLGNNKFIHASSAKKKVVITSLEKPFYKSRFKWGSRVKS